MLDSRYSDNEVSKRGIPSFIEPHPPLISNPFMRPKPQKGTNLLELFEEDSECEEPELVQVYLRLKPCNKPNNLYEVRSNRCLITSLDTTTAGHGRRTQHNVSKMYTFSHIFGPDSKQKDIFETVVKDNLKKLPEGHSFTLLAYGASGSGKTYTLMGTVSSPGLVPRSLEYVFKVVDAAQTPEFKPAERGAHRLNYAEQNYELQWVKRLRQISAPLREKYRRMSAQLFGDLTSSNMDLSNRTRYYVWVSFIEIYNEGIYDLLAPGDRNNAAKLAIREDSNGNVYVKGATQTFVKSGEEAYDVMVAGKHNLQVAATGIHAQSSRSHCIFTITMLTETSEGVRASHVRLCDLAGSERAARTRNTGARMHESRAINSSLHVLERCLRTLRTNLAAPTRLVPYRESKLTRVLGAGLSGSRGEAVGMVVTLNPAPEYAHETRHVLQLAAVAKDIQINNTMSEYPSSLECSSQDTTMACSGELMRLRADNERLHFELVQAQSRMKELQACMEARQATAAHTMREVVDEAKAITKEYYEAQLKALRNEMEEMIEEYESRLNKTVQATNGDTPSRNMQLKINQLVTENAILEEKYTAEKLARARTEEEVQHLRACIDERDEKSDDEVSTKEDVVDLSDSDVSDEDPCNESLEPTFKREDINRSRMKRQSTVTDNSLFSEHSDSVLDKTNGTLKDANETNNDCTYETGKDVSTNNDSFNENNVDDGDDVNEENKKDIKLSRETYFVENKYNDNDSQVGEKKVSSLSRATYCVSDKSDATFEFNSPSSLEENYGSLKSSSFATDDDHQPGEFINNIISSIKKSSQSNNSLALFESLEQAAKDNTDAKKNNTNFFNVKMLKEKRNFFENDNAAKSPETPATVVKCKDKKIYFDNLKTTDNETNKFDHYRSPSIVKDDVTDFTPSMIKKLLGKSISKKTESVQKVQLFAKKHDSIDLFEGLDSPIATKSQDIIENIRKSIQSVEIAQNDEMILRKNLDTIKNDGTEIKEEVNIEISPKENENATKNTDNINVKKENDCINVKYEATEVSEHKSNYLPANTSEHKVESEVKNKGTKVDDTLDEFENIYKDITAPRAAEFDLLVSQEIKDSTMDCTNNETVNEDLKYNLRLKSKGNKPKNETRRKKNTDISPPKCETVNPIRRNLRLRRRQNAPSDDNSDLDKDESKEKDTDKEVTKEKDVEKAKLKDIVNLQNEFSDVTMDKPVPIKPFKDIPSPEKSLNENRPPVFGIQSCPSKSVTRSRRKLFTPRPEPLEESDEQSVGSNERLHVPRPSYHKLRVRRKL